MSIRHLTACCKGNIAIMTALMAVPLLGVVGVAIDGIRSENLRTHLSTALDAAVLSGAVATTNQVTEAKTSFEKNFASGDSLNVVSSFKKTGDMVEGTATAELDPALMRVLGFTNFTVSVKSAAQAAQGTPPSAGDKLCILALSPNAGQALLANSGADINASSCEIHVKSTGNPAAIFNSGTTIKSAKTCIQGTNIIDNGGSHPNTSTGCTTLADPFVGQVPVPASLACDFNNSTYSGKTTLNPGVYCGWHNFNSGTDVDLNPGTYVIRNGGWNANGGTWDGKDVTFYFADTSKIQFNSAVKASLSAPKTGPYADFLFAEATGLSNSQFIFDDNKGFDMTGVIYLPSRDVVFNSSTKIETRKITAVMNTVIFNGVTWNLVHYDNGKGGGSGGSATTARLVK